MRWTIAHLLLCAALWAQTTVLPKTTLAPATTVAGALSFSLVQQAHGATVGGLVLTSVDGAGNYTGTITGCTSNTYNGYVFNITGFVNGGNNLTSATSTGCTSTTLSFSATTTIETHAGTASSFTVSIPVSPSLAAGNLDIFSCAVPAGTGNFNNSIASVSAGGTLVLAPGSSMGATTNSDQSLAQLNYHILPSTSTGGTTPIVITFAKNANSSTGACDFQEWHPSQNPNGVAIDIDSGYHTSTASTSNTNINVTQSGTNDVCFQQFMQSSAGATATAVTSPYDTNKYLAPAGGGGFSGAVTGGTGPTWTSNNSNMAMLNAMCWGWNVSPYNVLSLTDFDTGVNGNTPAAADLVSSTHGWQAGYWSVGGVGALKYDTAASMPLLNSTGRLGDGTSFAAGTGTLGLTLTGTGTATQENLKYNWNARTPITTMWASVKWTSDVVDTDLSNIDCFGIQGTAEYNQINCYGNATHRYWRVEGNGPAPNGPIVQALPSTACGSIGCTLVIQYQSGNGTTQGTMTLWVYDQTCTLLGTSSTGSGGTAVDYPLYAILGHASTQTLTSGKHMKWDSFQVGLGSVAPGC